MSGDGSDPNALPPALPAGFPRPFGPYLLLSSYGRGGMGEVFLAQRRVAESDSEAREELCVMKTLRRDLCNDKSYVRRFLDEARIVVRLEHPNICAVYDVGQAGDEYFMTMEHIAGTNLRELLAMLVDGQERLPPEVALWFGSEMLAALSWAHHATDPQTKQLLNVVHRDVSPHNVMISYDGKVKLIDFGLAESALKQEQTESHVVMGKVAYMSPEQARGEDVDATCDQFAAAVVIYECLTQDRYYGDLTTPRIWAVAGLGTYVPRFMHELAPDLRAVLQKALAAEPKQRFKSCSEFREALDAVRRRRGMTLGHGDAKAIMGRLFADRIKSHEAIAKAYSSGRVAAGTAPRAERAVNFVATRSGMLSALTSSLPAPHGLNVAEFTEKVDRDANVFRTSGFDHLPISDPAPSSDATMRVARNTGSFAPVALQPPPARSSPAVFIAGAVAVAAIALLALVVVTQKQPSVGQASVGQASAPAPVAPVVTPVPAVAPVVTPPIVTPPVVVEAAPAVVDNAPTVEDAPPIVDTKPPVVETKPDRPKIKKPVEPKPVEVETKPVDVEPPAVVPAGPDLNAKKLVFGYENTKRVVLACGTRCPAVIVDKVRTSTSEADLTGAVSPLVNKCVDKCMNAGIK